jgi:hypothetical protein
VSRPNNRGGGAVKLTVARNAPIEVAGSRESPLRNRSRPRPSRSSCRQSPVGAGGQKRASGAFRRAGTQIAQTGLRTHQSGPNEPDSMSRIDETEQHRGQLGMLIGSILGVRLSLVRLLGS